MCPAFGVPVRIASPGPGEACDSDRPVLYVRLSITLPPATSPFGSVKSKATTSALPVRCSAARVHFIPEKGAERFEMVGAVGGAGDGAGDGAGSGAGAGTGSGCGAGAGAGAGAGVRVDGAVGEVVMLPQAATNSADMSATVDNFPCNAVHLLVPHCRFAVFLPGFRPQRYNVRRVRVRAAPELRGTRPTYPPYVGRVPRRLCIPQRGGPGVISIPARRAAEYSAALLPRTPP